MRGRPELPKGSDLLVAALANEGVERVFGAPGEENLDVVEFLRKSKIKLVPSQQNVDGIHRTH